MSVQIQWGKLRFKVEGKLVRGVTNYSATLKAKGDSSKSKKAFTENETISFTITTSLYTGGNPLKDYDYLKTYINNPKKGSKMMINDGKKKKLVNYRGGKFRLTSVTLTNTQMDNKGRVLMGEINLSFEEVGTKGNGKKGKVKKYRKQALKGLKSTW